MPGEYRGRVWMRRGSGVWVDFKYPRDATKYGVFEGDMPEPLRGAIQRQAKAFRARYSALEWSRWRWQCDVMAEAWRRWLSDPGEVAAEIRGGVGIDYAHNEPDEEVQEANLSGYRTRSDGLIHKHYWLLVGPSRHVFDPTAHQEQFQREWPMTLDGYIVEGCPLPDWRRTPCRT